MRERGVVQVPFRAGRRGGRRGERQLATTDQWVREVVLQPSEIVSIEVRRVVRERHRQQGIDRDTEIEGGLHDEQIGARGHAGHDAQLGVREMLLELEEDSGHRSPQVRQGIRAQIAMPGNPNDER